MKHLQKEPEGLSSFIPNGVIGASTAVLVIVVAISVYCQMDSSDEFCATIKDRIADILSQ